MRKWTHVIDIKSEFKEAQDNNKYRELLAKIKKELEDKNIFQFLKDNNLIFSAHNCEELLNNISSFLSEENSEMDVDEIDEILEELYSIGDDRLSNGNKVAFVENI